MRPLDRGTARRIAVHTQHVDITRAAAVPPGLDRLPQVELLGRARADDRAASPSRSDDAAREASSFDVHVLDDGPSSVVTVRYALDQIARTWVAHVFDAQTGDLLREVPATEYHHQMALLAALRRKPVDTHA
jgi:hypothetical protein